MSSHRNVTRMLLILSMSVCFCTATLVDGPWSNMKDPPEQRAKALLMNMTQTEKLSILHGPQYGPCCSCTQNSSCAYVGNINAIDRLGIPPTTMNDGPQGFRDNVHPGTTTAWPSGLSMAASWDVDAMLEWGTGMGKEFYAKGANVQLGPGLCVARIPRNGRNFEYLSGEDPYLGYTLVQPVIKGIQSQKVVANAKHYIMNNQETSRTTVSEEVDERTRFEMYYPPFAGAIEAGVGSVMCSYNKINGRWSCENPTTLGDLKHGLGFKGYVMSDWGATHSTSIMEGLDVEMPSAKFMNADKLTQGISAGNITQSAVDDAVYRILYAMFAVGVMDEPASAWDWKKQAANSTTEASVKSARKLAAASTVLLKNEHKTLPLPSSADGSRKFAVLGFASDNAVVHGGGSGSVVPSYVARPVDAIKANLAVEDKVAYLDGTDVAAATALAAEADYAIVFVGTLSHEGGDRASLSLDDGCQADKDSNQCQGNNKTQTALVEAIASVNSRTIVVVSAPGAVLMPWSQHSNVTAVVMTFLAGQQTGNAVADVLFGVVNPSGRLPLTMPNMENETELTPAQWPGLPDASKPAYANYTERLLVGYRYYEAKKLAFSTGYPFGHGMSYTTFQYSDITIEGSKVSFDITNTGSVPGAEVAQLYLVFPSLAGEPPLQLKGFQKVLIHPGQSASITMQLTPRDLSIWNTAMHAFTVVKGDFQVKVGSSSRDIRQTGTLTSS